MSCTGVILAGGGASRYGGRPKGLERVGGERIIDRVAQALAHTTDELLLIANAPEAGSWLPGTRVAGDLRLGEGALGGLHAALSHAGTDIVLVAWDMPFVPAALLAELRAWGERTGADAVLPESDGSRRGVEPLCAWYSSRCLGAVEAAIASLLADPALARRLGEAGRQRTVSRFTSDQRAELIRQVILRR